MTQQVEVLRKITGKTLGFTKTDLQKIVLADGMTDGSEKEIYRVAGVISDIRPGSSDLGPYAKFLGEFVATRSDTGKTFASGVVLAPKVIEELLVGPVHQARRGGAAVEMAFAVGVKRDSTSATGYIFTSKPLMALQSSKRLHAVLQLAGMATPALAAPDPMAPEAPLLPPAEAPAPEPEKPARRR